MEKDPDFLVDLTTCGSDFEAQTLVEALKSRGIFAQAFTHAGSTLAWENAAGTVQTSTKLGALEAVWSASGALCLEATRLADAAVDCELPSCESLGQDPLAQGEWITHLPE